MTEKAMSGKQRGLAVVGIWSAWACAIAIVASTACGSEDSAIKVRHPGDSAGGGGDDGNGAAGDGQAAGGNWGGAGSGTAGGGEPTTAGAGGSGDAGAAASSAGAAASNAGAAGAAGAPGEDCESLDPGELAGTWTSACNGYTCTINIVASGAISAGCTNGQYESGTIEPTGAITTTGLGGAYPAYSTKGTLTRNDCSTLTRDYVGQIPPNTGPEVSYSCQLSRAADCAPSLLEALEGSWDASCGDGSTCTTTFGVTGEMSSACTNGQHSTGSIDETGAFADVGSGGNFPDYSTAGVIALQGCDAFVMPYTWQSPPNTGSTTSAKCNYVRHPDE